MLKIKNIELEFLDDIGHMRKLFLSNLREEGYFLFDYKDGILTFVKKVEEKDVT